VPGGRLPPCALFSSPLSGGGGGWAVFFFFFLRGGGGGGGFFFFFFFAISLMGVLASRLAWLNCHRILAGAILLERGCVVLGVRFSSAMLVWVAFEAWVFH